MSPHLCVNMALDRPSTDGEPETFDIVIYFDVVSFSPGCPARIRWDENDHPAEPPEYEFAFVRAELDLSERDRATNLYAPLSEAELETVRDWFDAHHDEAVDAAERDGGHER